MFTFQQEHYPKHKARATSPGKSDWEFAERLFTNGLDAVWLRKEEWVKISVSKWAKLVGTNPKRSAAAIELEDGSTRYWLGVVECLCNADAYPKDYLWNVTGLQVPPQCNSVRDTSRTQKQNKGSVLFCLGQGPAIFFSCIGPPHWWDSSFHCSTLP